MFGDRKLLFIPLLLLVSPFPFIYIWLTFPFYGREGNPSSGTKRGLRVFYGSPLFLSQLNLIHKTTRGMRRKEVKNLLRIKLINRFPDNSWEFHSCVSLTNFFSLASHAEMNWHSKCYHFLLLLLLLLNGVASFSTEACDVIVVLCCLCLWQWLSWKEQETSL